MTLFDAYLFIDWSAANVVHPQHPTANSVWIGELINHSGFKRETYFRTRNAAIEHVLASLLNDVKASRRVLVGFDFPYGYGILFSTGSVSFELLKKAFFNQNRRHETDSACQLLANLRKDILSRSTLNDLS